MMQHIEILSIGHKVISTGLVYVTVFESIENHVSELSLKANLSPLVTVKTAVKLYIGPTQTSMTFLWLIQAVGVAFRTDVVM